MHFLIAGNIYFSRWIPFVLYIVLGISAALLWTTQGVYITLSASQHEKLNSLPVSSTRVFINGVFFSLFLLHQSAGTGIASLLFYFKFSSMMVFSLMTGFSLLGTITIILFKPTELPK